MFLEIKDYLKRGIGSSKFIKMLYTLCRIISKKSIIMIKLKLNGRNVMDKNVRGTIHGTADLDRDTASRIWRNAHRHWSAAAVLFGNMGYRWPLAANVNTTRFRTAHGPFS